MSGQRYETDLAVGVRLEESPLANKGAREIALPPCAIAGPAHSPRVAKSQSPAADAGRAWQTATLRLEDVGDVGASELEAHLLDRLVHWLTDVALDDNERIPNDVG